MYQSKCFEVSPVSSILDRKRSWCATRSALCVGREDGGTGVFVSKPVLFHVHVWHHYVMVLLYLKVAKKKTSMPYNKQHKYFFASQFSIVQCLVVTCEPPSLPPQFLPFPFYNAWFACIAVGPPLLFPVYFQFMLFYYTITRRQWLVRPFSLLFFKFQLKHGIATALYPYFQ